MKSERLDEIVSIHQRVANHTELKSDTCGICYLISIATKMNFEDLEQKVVQWGKDRLIFERSDCDAQCEKLYEEWDELSDAILFGDYSKMKDSIGDMLVVLTMIAHMNKWSLSDCYHHAYNEIKDRKGKIVDGIFVKEA